MLETMITSPKTYIVNNVILKENEAVELININIDMIIGSLKFDVINKNGNVFSFKYENVWAAMQTGWDVLPIINNSCEEF